jgi:hypothetical protein
MTSFSPTHPFKSKHTSELARDDICTINIVVDCHDLIASKLAPTVVAVFR